MTIRTVAIVCQRYGQTVIGGAEHHAALLAQRLVSTFGLKVTVFTTCALDSDSWANHFLPGESEERGIRILRFPTQTTRRPWLKKALTALLSILPRRRPWLALRMTIEDIWIRAQGPVAPALLQTLRSQTAQFDVIFAFTYLYWPTVSAIQALPHRVILVPTAHRERPFFFERIQQTLDLSRLLATNSAAEEKLILECAPSLQPKIRRVGIAVEPWKPWPHRPKEIPSDRPYVLFCGRIDRAKCVPELIAAFLRAIHTTPAADQPNLVLMGARTKGVTLPDHPRIVATGPVPLAAKQAAIDHCLCVINPSKQESLSLLVLEALLAGKPCLVNCESDVLADYAEKVETVLGFRGFQECPKALSSFLANPRLLNEEQIQRAREWVEREYGTGAVDRRIQSLIDEAMTIKTT